jgi:hypothetical protein
MDDLLDVLLYGAEHIAIVSRRRTYTGDADNAPLVVASPFTPAALTSARMDAAISRGAMYPTLYCRGRSSGESFHPMPLNERR